MSTPTPQGFKALPDDSTHSAPLVVAEVSNWPSSQPVSGTVDTELPAAAALNGTIAKSVAAPVVGAALLVSDNTNLVQPLGDAANGLDVDITRVAAPASVISGNVSVTTAATQILAAYATRAAATLINRAGSELFIGTDNTVAVATGFSIPVGASFTVESTTAIWGIVASGTADVRYWSERF